MTKQSHPSNGYVSTYDVEILKYFNPELQLKDTETEMRNKQKDLLTELKGLKFVMTVFFLFNMKG